MKKTEINLDQYPQLKVQADYILKVDGLIEKLETRRSLLLKRSFMDEKEENDRQIMIDKTDLEIQGLKREMVEKKRKYQGLIAVLKSTLSEMESSFDSLVEQAKGFSPDFNSEIENDEQKLDVYLNAKEIVRRNSESKMEVVK